jgi:hypothetical protein
MGTVANFPPQNGRGKNTGNGSEPPMEARIAKLEAAVSHIEADIKDVKQDIRDMRVDIGSVRKEANTDFRILFGALIAASLGLAAIMAKGFGWLN